METGEVSAMTSPNPSFTGKVEELCEIVRKSIDDDKALMAYVGSRLKNGVVLIDGDVDIKAIVLTLLRALREPTPGMDLAAVNRIDALHYSRFEAREGYTAMIDHLIEGGS
jgi:hypothetical protein